MFKRKYSNAVFILGQDYSHVVLESLDPQKSLFTLDALYSVCELQKRLMDGNEMSEICETVSPGHCCVPWSLPNYLTLLYNRSDCFSLTVNNIPLIGQFRFCFNVN